jgi:hypothetical protein
MLSPMNNTHKYLVINYTTLLMSTLKYCNMYAMEWPLLGNVQAL